VNSIKRQHKKEQEIRIVPQSYEISTPTRLVCQKLQTLPKAHIFEVLSLIRFALMIEAARTSETFLNFNQTTRHYNPEDSHLRTHRRENLKSYL
jgi:hypothetical protein